MNDNNEILTHKGKQYNFLLDTSAIIYFEKMWQQCGASIFTALNELSDVNFFVCNMVLSEFISGPNRFDPTQLTIFFDHVLNAESAMNPDMKENRFIVEEDGELKYIVLNRISPTDYAQILLCQNHPQLTLVTNDRRMLRSGAHVIPGRIIGIPALLNRLLSVYPENQRLLTLRDTADRIFDKKRAIKIT